MRCIQRAVPVILAVLLLSPFLLPSWSLCAGADSPRQRLLAHRAARMDALRNLSEQIYGMELHGGSTVRNFTLISDTVSSRLAVTIQGAREIHSQELADGTVEVTVVIPLGRVETILGQQLNYFGESIEAVGYGVPGAVSLNQTVTVDPVATLVRAKGYGLAPRGSELSQAEKNLLGFRAAKNDALRNLAEKIDDVKITAGTTVQQFAVTSDQVQARVQTSLHNARQVSQKKLSDGRYEVEMETKL